MIPTLQRVELEWVDFVFPSLKLRHLRFESDAMNSIVNALFPFGVHTFRESTQRTIAYIAFCYRRKCLKFKGFAVKYTGHFNLELIRMQDRKVYIVLRMT